MCLTKIELSKITYSFQILFKFGLKLLLVCFFFAIFPMKIPSSPWGLLVYYNVNGKDLKVRSISTMVANDGD